MKLPIIPLAFVLCAVCLTSQAQEKSADTPPIVNGQAAPPGYVDFSAGSTSYTDKDELTVFTKDVTATQVGENFILYAQRAVSSNKTNTATATQDLRIETRDSTIRGEQLYADFNKKVFSITGSVRITSYGENDGVAPDAAAPRRTEQKRKPVRISCDRLDWNYDTRQATLVGNIRIVSEDSVGTCKQIIYDETKNAARLLGDVRFGNPKRQQFLADELLVFIDTGAIQNTTGVRVVGPINNLADGEKPPAPKQAETFADPIGIGDIKLPTPPPDIEKFLPKPGAPQGKPPVIPAEKPAPKPDEPPAPEKPAPEKPAPDKKREN